MENKTIIVILVIIILYLLITQQCKSYENFSPDTDNLIYGSGEGDLLKVQSTQILIPKGTIVIWSGSKTEIPYGWVLCDGTNGTPNLGGRFVLGANTSYDVGKTGGVETVTLSMAQMPKHRHIENKNSPNLVIGANLATGYMGGLHPGGNYNVSSAVQHDYQGSDQPHENMPPYHALLYIMKII